MVESVSLAGITETPIVMVVGQRPGPATGLPTRTEQGELEFVLHSGHGEFPRAVFAPGDAEQCFHLARKALELAEHYQTPVFILTDLYLADCYQAVPPFEIESLPQSVPETDQQPVSTPYKRYAITKSGVSPRLLPGALEHLVVADSDEHDEAGHLTEDLSLRTKMVDKRLRKGDGLRKEVVPPDYEGEDSPDMLLVSWGSTRGSALEAASELRDRGVRAATMHFSQVWPLVPEQFIDRLKAAKQVVSIESNAFGQFARLIRRETGFHIRKQVHRYDGLPITPEYILRHVEK
jgi:2-oxoglutarate ferredoxin oxidoreductase subunit alpha